MGLLSTWTRDYGTMCGERRSDGGLHCGSFDLTFKVQPLLVLSRL